MDDDSHVIDKGWDALPDYAQQAGEDDAVTISISTTPGEWLVNTVDSVVVPMSMADVVDALRARKLTELSLVWRNGMPEWAPIDKVPQLKLAARLPAAQPQAAPARPSSPAPAARPSTPSKPSSPPVRATPAPQLGAPIGVSRRATLPFGLPTPNPSSRPAQPRPSSPPMSAAPPSDEPVLAVYARPAATISFDLSPSEPARLPPPVPTPPPQTLAPTTSDARSAPRAPALRPPAYNADLSVVAASQFRAVQRTSKQRLLVSSLVSAAAASALTLWLSGGVPWSRPTSAKPAPPAPPAAAALVAPAAPVAAPAPPASPPPETSAAAALSSAPSSAPLAKAVIAPAARPAAAPRKARPAAPRVAEAGRTGQTDAKGEGNDVKLDEAGSADAAGKPPARGLLEMIQANERGDVEAKPPEAKPPEASAATSSAPGF